MSSANSPFLFVAARAQVMHRLLATITLGMCLAASGILQPARAQGHQEEQGTQAQAAPTAPTPTATTPTRAPLSAIQVLLKQGKAAMVAHKNEQAEKIYRQALALAQAQTDKVGESDALLNLGTVFDRTNRSNEALTTYALALSLYRAHGDRRSEAFVLTSIADVYKGTGRPSEALTNYQQALSIYRATSNKRGEVNTLYSIGAVYRDIGRLSEVLRIYQEALAIYRAASDVGDPANAFPGSGADDEGTSRPSRESANFQQTLSIARSIGGKPFEARALLDIGTIYEETGHPVEALANFQQALAIYRSARRKPGADDALSDIGAAFSTMGRPAEALTSFQQALTLYRVVHSKLGEAKALIDIGAIYHNTDRPFEALMTYQQALVIHRAIGDKGGEATDLHYKANIERKTDEQAAKADYAESIDLIEQIRTDLGGYTSAKQAYSASARSAYADYLDFLMTAPRSDTSDTVTAAAFALAQQTKGRSLLDLLEGGQVDLTGSLTDMEKAQLQTLRQASNALNVQLVQEGVENEVGARARFAALQHEQRENESKLQRLTETLYAQHPDLAEKRSARTANVADLAPLLDADSVLLEYVQTTPDKIALFAVTRGKDDAPGDSIHVVTQYLSVPDTLASDCDAFHDACADPRKDYRPFAIALYKTLIAPVASAIAGKKRLILCPDGPLWNIPFQALLAEDSKTFLADRFEIDYAYSATGALAARSERRRQQAQPTSKDDKGSLLVVANPAFGDARRFGDLDDLPGQRPIDKPSRPIGKPSRPIDTPSRAMAASLERTGGHIAALPGTQREADALQTLFPQAIVLTGEAAQEGEVKQDAPRFRYLHFATHGFVNDGAPLLSSLILAQPSAADKAAGDDGFLTARELFDLRLPQTEMVTLSACNTGRGNIQSGEGVVGLTWALFAAGCPTQVVSQWSVDDACTATLMARFYAELKAGKPKGQALHDAARATASERGKDAVHRHPYYWAPFVLFGEWK